MTPIQQLGPFADVPVSVEMELDRMILTVSSILALEMGSVVKTARSAGENIDIRIGGSLIGFGEIVVIEERLGVRITDFVSED